MGIFLVQDEYTDVRGAFADLGTGSGPTAGAVTWDNHIPVALGGGKVLLITTQDRNHNGTTTSPPAPQGPQARIYTLTDTTWTRGDPVALPASSIHAQACATTLDGSVVLQHDNSHLSLISVATDGTMTTHPGPDYSGDGGGLYTGPDSMARFPGANAFVMWRYYPVVTTLYLDLFTVTGTTIAGKSTVSMVGLFPYNAPDTPRQIIPISNNEAVSAMVMPNGLIKLVHISFTGDIIGYQTQDVTGYEYTPDLSLFPSTAHHAEMMVRYNSTTNELRRFGVDFNGTQFVLTAMPLTQLPTGLAPDDYHPIRTDAGVRPSVDASYLAVGGAIYVARHYVDDGHDDNFMHLTQYDQDTGQVLDQVFSKGDENGAAFVGGNHRAMYISNMHLAFDDTTGELIVGATDNYSPLNSARLATFRVTYALGESRRSRNASFEP